MDTTTTPFCPEIYLQLHDNTKLLNILVQHPVIIYFQCVNDILIFYLQIATNIREYLNMLNNLTPTMHFIIQEEYENTINFLDVTIS
jgi:hypothetical protein